ncbi:hypothetical protein MBLNU459_g4540t1 [Dothideomycetes sp. NU459]
MATATFPSARAANTNIYTSSFNFHPKSYHTLSHQSSTSSFASLSAAGPPRAGASIHGRRGSAHASLQSYSSLNRPLIPAMNSSSSSIRRQSHGKLHKRSDSASSIIMGPPIVPRMPVPIEDDYSPDFGHQRRPSLRSGSSNKIKPYLRKMSLRDDGEDQGRLDLSRPSAENDALAGLGIGGRSVSDVSFQPAARRRSSVHARAASGNSQLSTSSAPLRPTQPFVHPMRQTPRPYTPPSAISYRPSHPEEEADESADVMTNDMCQPEYEPLRHNRAASMSSFNPGLSIQVPSTGSLTRLGNRSQSNLSTMSDKSAKEKTPRGWRNAEWSMDATSPSSRTSFDKAISLFSRTSEQQEDAAARAASIRAARRAFEEREAAKERKLEQEQVKRAKREEKQRRKSEAYEGARHCRSRSDSGNATLIIDEMSSKEYSNFAPVHTSSLPVQGEHGGIAAPPARANTDLSKTKVAKGGWMRFMAWTRTRLLSCGA